MATVLSFETTLTECGLGERSILATARAALVARGEEPTDENLAAELVRRGHLTRWQADELLAGRDDHLLIGGKYLVLDVLGRGGMGEVYKARHTRIPGRLVALKVLARHKMSDPKALSRFQREVAASGRLDHPNLVRTLDVDQHGEAEVLVLEYIEGDDLARRVRADGPLPWPQVVEIGRQMARGLDFAHEAGIVHRDIKPQNVMLARDGTVKVLDMGLARLLKPEFVGPSDQAARLLADAEVVDQDPADSDDMLTHSGLVMGTVDFMAPEQARDTRLADHRSDLYSLGATLWFCLTGRSPLAGGNITSKLTRLQLETPPSLSELCPQVPAEVASIIHRLLAKRPEDRCRSALEVASAFDQIASASLTSEATAPCSLPPAARAAAGGNGTLDASTVVGKPSPSDLRGLHAYTKATTDGWIPSPAAILAELSQGLEAQPSADRAARGRGREGSPKRSVPRFWSWKVFALVLPLCGAAAVAALMWPRAGEGFVHPSGQVTAAAHASGLVAIAGDSTVVLRERESEEMVGELAPLPPFPILSVDLTPDGRWLAACGPSQQFWIWDLHAEGRPGWSLSVSENGCTAARFSPDGRRLALVMSEEGGVSLWELADPSPSGTGGPPVSSTPHPSGTGGPPVEDRPPWNHVADLDSLPKCPSGAVSPGYSAAWSPDGRFLAVAGSKAWHVFSFHSGVPRSAIAMQDALEGDIKGVALVGDRLLALIDDGADSRAVVWNWRTEEIVATVPVHGFFHEAREYRVVLDLDGRRAFLPGEPATTWDVESGSVAPILPDQTTAGLFAVPGQPALVATIDDSRQDRAAFIAIDRGP